MSKIELFKGIRLQHVEGEILVNLEDAARGLGFVRMKNDVEYVRWDRVNKYLKDFDVTQKLGKEDFISETIFYLLGMKGENQKAKEFQIKVAKDIIPEFRKQKKNKQLPKNYISALEALVASEKEKLQLESENQSLNEALDQSEQWISIIRAAKELGIHETKFKWRILKKYSLKNGIEIKTAPCPRYVTKKLYHVSVFRKCYPDYYK